MNDIASASLALIVSWSIAGAAAMVAIASTITARRARKEREQLYRWLRGSLLQVRVNCYSSEEAMTVVNTLERAAPVLAPIDGNGLFGHLHRLRRERDSRLLEAAGRTAAAVAKAKAVTP